MNCLFVSDLHGHISKYECLFDFIKKNPPDAVFFGGDLLPIIPSNGDNIPTFVQRILFSPIQKIQEEEKDIEFFLILGNDDPKRYEYLFKEADSNDIITYVHERTVAFSDLFVSGYAYVPPTPFQLKDWERYDISRFVDVGAISPEDGTCSVPTDMNKRRFETIEKDLQRLQKNSPMDKTIFLFHAPPYDSLLDRADLDGKKIDHCPVDVHIGSIAIKRFINRFQPFITLHGHVHESSQFTGEWRQLFDNTFSFSAAYTDEKLAIIQFDTDNPDDAIRHLFCV